MCFFPKKLNIKDSFGELKQIECGCGVCPECLKRKSRQWALRCYYQSLETPGMMLTLTYDNFVYDSRGKIVGERLPEKDLKVNKRDCQLFIKRLRKYIKGHVPGNPKIFYLITAEYGKTTHRPHYHCLIFGYVFEDIIFHKMSKRGNRIYRSKTLANIWGNGICTVDCINITPAVAQYCTKYCSKDSGKQSDDTFMLFSRNIGVNGLLANFNGQRYILEGQDYPIPKLIWQKWLQQKYEYMEDFACNYETGELLPFSFKYRSSRDYDYSVVDFYRQANLIARKIRDTDIVYNDYINFWSDKIETIALTRPSVEERIKLLQNDRYHSYKIACLRYLMDLKDKKFVPFVPREKFTPEKYVSRFCRYYGISKGWSIPRNWKGYRICMSVLSRFRDFDLKLEHLPRPTCCIGADDTNKQLVDEFTRFARRCDLEKEWQSPLLSCKKVDLRLI